VRLRIVDEAELREDLAGRPLADDLLEERRPVENGIAQRARWGGPTSSPNWTRKCSRDQPQIDVPSPGRRRIV
jgi:hypothetical protein